MKPLTLDDFLALSLQQQLKVLEAHDGPVSFREDDTSKIILRQINDFYVEVYYKFLESDCYRVKAFKSFEELEPWIFKLAPRTFNYYKLVLN